MLILHLESQLSWCLMRACGTNWGDGITSMTSERALTGLVLM
jgi:hypothetical protein